MLLTALEETSDEDIADESMSNENLSSGGIANQDLMSKGDDEEAGPSTDK